MGGLCEKDMNQDVFESKNSLNSKCITDIRIQTVFNNVWIISQIGYIESGNFDAIVVIQDPEARSQNRITQRVIQLAGEQILQDIQYFKDEYLVFINNLTPPPPPHPLQEQVDNNDEMHENNANQDQESKQLKYQHFQLQQQQSLDNFQSGSLTYKNNTIPISSNNYQYTGTIVNKNQPNNNNNNNITPSQSSLPTASAKLQVGSQPNFAYWPEKNINDNQQQNQNQNHSLFRTFQYDKTSYQNPESRKNSSAIRTLHQKQKLPQKSQFQIKNHKKELCFQLTTVFNTGGGSLQADHIIHGILPDYLIEDDIEEKETIMCTVLNCLEKANKLKVKTLAFPFFYTPHMNISPEEAARILLHSIKIFLEHQQEIFLNKIFIIPENESRFMDLRFAFPDVFSEDPTLNYQNPLILYKANQQQLGKLNSVENIAIQQSESKMYSVPQESNNINTFSVSEMRYLNNMQ